MPDDAPLQATCTKCGETKLREDYSPSRFRAHVVAKRAVWCRACQREYYRQDRVVNPEKQRGYVTAHRRRAMRYAARRRSELGCAVCGERHPACLDFHHRDPSTKTRTIAQMSARGTSPKRMEEEIAKCVVLCANCHRKQHHAHRYDFQGE